MAGRVDLSAVTRQYSRPGLRRSGGYVMEEFLRDLTGRQASLKYREMTDNDPIVGALFFLMYNLLKSVDWQWEAASLSDDDQEARDFLAEEFAALEDPWPAIIDQAAGMFPFGWSLAEIVYKQREDGRLGWENWSFIAQETLLEWIFDENDRPSAFVQQVPNDWSTVTVPLAKCLHFRTTRMKENPEGRSVLRNGYLPWYYKNRLQELEAIGIERDLAGLPLITMPVEYMGQNADDDQKALYRQMQEIVRNIRRDEHEGLILPSDVDANGKPMMELKLLSSGGQRQTNPDVVIRRYEQRQTMVVLADFLMLGHEKVGSFALSDDKTDLFATAFGAYVKDMAGVVNKQGGEKLLRLNGMPGKARLVPGDFEKRAVAAMVDAIARLVPVGAITPDPGLEAWVRQEIGAPKLSEEFVNAERVQAGDDTSPLPGRGRGGKGAGAGEELEPDAGNAPALRE